MPVADHPPAPLPEVGFDIGLRVHRDFRLLVAGQTISQLGSQVTAVAVPLVAVVTLHASPLQVAALGASATASFLLAGLHVGQAVDRRRRRPVLIGADVVRGSLLISIPLAATLGVLSFPQLLIVALATGLARVFFDVAYQSYLPTLVGRSNALRGNAVLEAIRSVGQIVGPGLGGVIIALTSAATTIVLDALSYFASALSLIKIRAPEPAPIRSDAAPAIRAGLRYVAGDPVLRATAVTSAAMNGAFMAASAVVFIFLARDLRLSASWIGVLIAAGSAPAMVGAAVTPYLARRVGSARIIWLSLLLTAPFTLLVPLAAPGWRAALFVVGNAVFEFGQIVYSISSLSLRQAVCPDALLGRTNAAMRVLIMGVLPLGSIAGGVLGELLGVRPTLWIVGAVLALSPLPLLRPLRGIRDVPV